MNSPEDLQALVALLEGATLSATSFDGHAVRIDYETRDEALRTLDLLDALRSRKEQSR
jgi:hypothetical protein